LEQFLDAAVDFDANFDQLLQETPEEEAIDQPLVAFLNQLSLSTDMDMAADEERSCLTMMTLHSAKGLEFPVVFLAGMEEGVFPHKKAIYSPEIQEMEEERRLCYVGLTRAQKRLYLTAAARRQFWGNFEANKQSRFIGEIPEELLHRTGLSTRKERLPQRQDFVKTNNLFAPRIFKDEKRNTSADVLVGDKLVHEKFGDGVVVACSGSGDDLQVSVMFPDYGEKKLMWKYAPVKKI